MSRPYWSARYVPSRKGLPDKLIRGRAYFIGDEQIMIIDYGNGPIEYGNKPGPQGIPGEPIPQLQHQIDSLAGASIDTTYHIYEFYQKFLKTRDNMSNRVTKIFSQLQTKDDEITRSIEDTNVTLSDLAREFREYAESTDAQIREYAESTNAQIEEIQNVISIILKLLVSLYPSADTDTEPSEPETASLTPGEILTTESGSYKVKETVTNSDGSITVILDYLDDTDTEYVNTLEEGDTFTTSDGYTWNVESNEITDSEGTILLSETSMKMLIDTLKPGDAVSVGGLTYSVDSAEVADGQGTIRLTLSE